MEFLCYPDKVNENLKNFSLFDLHWKKLYNIVSSEYVNVEGREITWIKIKEFFLSVCRALKN